MCFVHRKCTAFVYSFHEIVFKMSEVIDLKGIPENAVFVID